MSPGLYADPDGRFSVSGIRPTRLTGSLRSAAARPAPGARGEARERAAAGRLAWLVPRAPVVGRGEDAREELARLARLPPREREREVHDRGAPPVLVQHLHGGAEERAGAPRGDLEA